MSVRSRLIRLRLILKVDLPAKTVKAQADLDCRALRRLDVVQLDAVGFDVHKVLHAVADGEPKEIHFSHDGAKLTVDLSPTAKEDEDLRLRILYTIHEPKSGLHFFGPTKDEPNTPLTVWSQGEPTGNRYWIPCFDQPNVRQATEKALAQGCT